MMAVRAERAAWILGAVGIAVSALGWVLRPAEFPHAWLAALACWVGWPIGSLALIFIHALTGGRWGHAIRRELAAGIATLPLVLPVGLPILFVLPMLYPWMRPEMAEHLDNRFYLNAPFFYIRCLVYVAVWLGLGFWVLRALKQEDCESILYRLAPPALILLALSVTFSAIDFTLSMDPHFKSSIYGMLIGCESVLLALSVAVMATALAGGQEGPHMNRDFGRLLFALLVLWAYLDFMQVLIIWNSDLPEEAVWYLRRLQGGWLAVAVLIAICHFLLPFFALIWPQVQRSRRMLCKVAALLVLIEVARVWWIVIPAAGRGLKWVDVAAIAAVLGVAAAIALRAFRRTNLPSRVPAHA
jgi:hypothetical protein